MGDNPILGTGVLRPLASTLRRPVRVRADVVPDAARVAWRRRLWGVV